MTNDMVFGWCWCKYIEDWNYSFLYWKPFDYPSSNCLQVIHLKILFYTAGFVHMWKHYHWKRHSLHDRY